MIHKIVKTLEELYFVRNENERMRLLGMSVPQLMEEFVFPNCLCLPRSGIRYPRIDGRFMELMARHGKDFLAVDYELGSILLECAMQRLSRHPELPAIDYKGNLPEKWRAYSAGSVNPDGINGCPDEPGLWGSEEVHFIVEMLPVCLNDLREPKHAEHAKLLLFQILTKLTDGFFGMGEKYCDMKAKDVWQAAYQMLLKMHLEVDFVDYCVANKDGWRIGFKVFQNWAWESSSELVDYLLDEINLEREVYYEGPKRQLFKFFGVYEKETRRRIQKELASA